ncbi:hydrogenase maturation protease [Candidatus Bathyarchaeota archaeon]|nr:hydrogenase maturation protease [Candidatus Bathyarchaeota archaeon]
MPSASDVSSQLKIWFQGAQRVVLIGVGNTLRKDDNIGVEIAADLEEYASESVMVVKSETIPEEYLEQIVDFKPTHVLVIDAALLGLKPGSARFSENIEAPSSPVSTHFLPVQIFCQSLVDMTGAKLAMLLIEPRDTGFGEGLTRELNYARKRYVSLLKDNLKSLQE